MSSNPKTTSSNDKTASKARERSPSLQCDRPFTSDDEEDVETVGLSKSITQRRKPRVSDQHLPKASGAPGSVATSSTSRTSSPSLRAASPSATAFKSEKLKFTQPAATHSAENQAFSSLVRLQRAVAENQEQHFKGAFGELVFLINSKADVPHAVRSRINQCFRRHQALIMIDSLQDGDKYYYRCPKINFEIAKELADQFQLEVHDATRALARLSAPPPRSRTPQQQAHTLGNTPTPARPPNDTPQKKRLSGASQQDPVSRRATNSPKRPSNESSATSRTSLASREDSPVRRSSSSTAHSAKAVVITLRDLQLLRTELALRNDGDASEGARAFVQRIVQGKEYLRAKASHLSVLSALECSTKQWRHLGPEEKERFGPAVVGVMKRVIEMLDAYPTILHEDSKLQPWAVAYLDMFTVPEEEGQSGVKAGTVAPESQSSAAPARSSSDPVENHTADFAERKATISVQPIRPEERNTLAGKVYLLLQSELVYSSGREFEILYIWNSQLLPHSDMTTPERAAERAIAERLFGIKGCELLDGFVAERVLSGGSSQRNITVNFHSEKEIEALMQMFRFPTAKEMEETAQQRKSEVAQMQVLHDRLRSIGTMPPAASPAASAAATAEDENEVVRKPSADDP